MSVKLVAVGDGAVGKTSMLICYTKNEFPEAYVPTVFDNYTTNVSYGKEVVQLQIWDTAGQEEYESFRPLSYPSTDIFLLCFNVIQPSSLTNIIEKWYPEVKQYCPTSKTIVVGLKIDLRDSVREIHKLEERGQKPVTLEEVSNVIRDSGIQVDRTMECSAKTQKGLKEVFYTAVELCMVDKKQNQVHQSDKTGSVENGDKKQKCCCVLL
ncbi:Rho GTPase, putative [Entamoeba invadens IP1]|uniref:small monomeric GTPase n=1 Tax=Entamoeba invadens IP1 TaxID=370355 RepID=L7FK95_ENTIV|nr:Rho GTPase, putative [Entamoeba invadens IP1]ELP84832.1 Rho GTPase, putative [Entamoeba invadens IP1]|eukprot:XP_004184178.1 Rho GTPase, putative [Entamoeba invadens IP1]